MNKYLFLDIDGVINPLKRKSQDLSVLIDFGQPHGKFAITISPSIKELLHELIEDGFTIVWASTWCHGYHDQIETLAQHYELPADMDKIDLIYWGDDHGTKIESGCGKLGGIINWCQQNNVDAANSIILWIDDQLSSYDWEWADTYGVCAVKPNPMSGLKDINARTKIRNFVKGTTDNIFMLR